MTTHAIMPTYGRLDVEFIKGEGCWLIDKDGRRYLDALSGLGVVALGHAHPRSLTRFQHRAERYCIHRIFIAFPIKNDWLIAWPRYQVWRTCSSAIRALKRASAPLKLRACTGTKRDCRARDYRRR